MDRAYLYQIVSIHCPQATEAGKQKLIDQFERCLAAARSLERGEVWGEAARVCRGVMVEPKWASDDAWNDGCSACIDACLDRFAAINNDLCEAAVAQLRPLQESGVGYQVEEARDGD